MTTLSEPTGVPKIRAADPNCAWCEGSGTWEDGSPCIQCSSPPPGSGEDAHLDLDEWSRTDECAMIVARLTRSATGEGAEPVQVAAFNSFI